MNGKPDYSLQSVEGMLHLRMGSELKIYFSDSDPQMNPKISFGFADIYPFVVYDGVATFKVLSLQGLFFFVFFFAC